MQFWDRSLELISAPKLINDLSDLLLNQRLLFHRLPLTKLGSCKILSFSVKYDIDPLLNMVVLGPMDFYDLIGLPDRLLSYFNQFVYHGFYDSYAHFVVLRLLIMVNNTQVLMDHK